MAIEIEQIRGDVQFKQQPWRFAFGRTFDQLHLRQAGRLVHLRQQGQQQRLRRLALRIDGQLFQVAPAARQGNGVDLAAQRRLQLAVQGQLAFGVEQRAAGSAADDKGSHFLTLASRRIAQQDARVLHQRRGQQCRFDGIEGNAFFFDLHDAVATPQQLEASWRRLQRAVGQT